MSISFQIGKQGVNSGVIESLALAFKNHKTVRISVLKSCSPTKERVREIADELVESLGGNFHYTLIGFTVILSKSKRQE